MTLIKSTRIPRHLIESPGQLKSNRVFHEPSLILPNGKKVHEVQREGLDLDAYCQEQFGRPSTVVLEELKEELVERLDSAVEMLAIWMPAIKIGAPLESMLCELEIEMTSVAKQGGLDAQLQLGMLYCSVGRFFGHSEEEGVSWLLKAYGRNHTDAAAELGVYNLRQGSYQAAIKYFRTGDKRGCAFSRFKLAEFYRDGSASLEQNLSKAFGLFKRAAEQGHPLATVQMVEMYLADDCAYRLPAAPAELLQEAVADGSKEAMYVLADMYEYADHAPKNLPAALDLYQQAAYAGLPVAQLKMGKILETGEWGELLVEQSLDDAIDWYNQAARNSENPEVQKQAHIALVLIHNRLHDYAQVCIHVKEAAELGSVEAQKMLPSAMAMVTLASGHSSQHGSQREGV